MAGRLGVTAGLTKHNFLAIVFTSPAALCAAMAEFIEFHNYRRYHEWIRNVAPADVYFGRWEEIRNQRKEQKQATIQGRSQYSLGQAPIPLGAHCGLNCGLANARVSFRRAKDAQAAMLSSGRGLT